LFYIEKSFIMEYVAIVDNKITMVILLSKSK